MLIKNVYQHQHQPHYLHNGIATATDRANLPLSKKIENEIFDKSIEDIEKIFNFKIKSTLDFNESSLSLSSSSSQLVTNNNNNNNTNEFLSSSANRKRKVEDTEHFQDCHFDHKRQTRSTESSNVMMVGQNKRSNNGVRPPQVILKSSRDVLPNRPRDNRILVNSIYLQDFNTFRDDLLDELFELHETLKNLN